jgi:hypothetical protein
MWGRTTVSLSNLTYVEQHSGFNWETLKSIECKSNWCIWFLRHQWTYQDQRCELNQKDTIFSKSTYHLIRASYHQHLPKLRHPTSCLNRGNTGLAHIYNTFYYINMRFIRLIHSSKLSETLVRFKWIYHHVLETTHLKIDTWFEISNTSTFT